MWHILFQCLVRQPLAWLSVFCLLSGCREQLPTLQSDEEFDRLDEQEARSDVADPEWGTYAASFLAHPDTRQILADMAIGDQCAFLKDEGSVDRSAPFVLVTIPGQCSRSGEALLTGLFPRGPSGPLTVSGEIAAFSGEEVTALALFDMHDGATLRRDFSGAALDGLLVADLDDEGSDEAVAALRGTQCQPAVGVSCRQGALTASRSNCARCRDTLRALYRQAPCGCRLGARATCGLLKRSRGKDGVVCRRTVRAACKIGVKKLMKSSTLEACQSSKLRLCKVRS